MENLSTSKTVGSRNSTSPNPKIPSLKGRIQFATSNSTPTLVSLEVPIDDVFVYDLKILKSVV